MKLWPIKEDGVVRPLPALPWVIANAFQCNGCVRLPNFDLLIPQDIALFAIPHRSPFPNFPLREAHVQNIIIP